MQAGLLPGFEPFTQATPQTVTLTHNDCGTFRDQWVAPEGQPRFAVRLHARPGRDRLPVRHGEGKFVVENEAVLRRLIDGNQIVYQYVDAFAKRR